MVLMIWENHISDSVFLCLISSSFEYHYPTLISMFQKILVLSIAKKNVYFEKLFLKQQFSKACVRYHKVLTQNFQSSKYFSLKFQSVLLVNSN